MKIVFITEWTPTPDNYNGPSANLYHVFTGLPKNCELTIYTTNRNNVAEPMLESIRQNLKAEVHVLHINRKIQRIKQKFFNFIDKFQKCKYSRERHLILPQSIVERISVMQPDIIWLYPHSLIGVAKQFCNKFKIVVTGADCASLHLSRVLRDQYAFEVADLSVCIDNYYRMLNTEYAWGTLPNTKIVLVGMTDEEYMNTIMGNEHSKFFPHPHYNLADKEISFTKEKIKVLISGKYDIYTYSDANKMLKSFCNSHLLKIRKCIEYTFHGKSWMPFVEGMKKAGYDVKLTGWVDDYVKFLSKYDVQIFPISIGSGTKGKCLDALSTGLLCIGSDYCFENISIVPNESALIYKHAAEIPEILNRILDDKEKSKNIAEQGRTSIRRYHDPKINTPAILEWVINDIYNVNTKNYYRVNLK